MSLILMLFPTFPGFCPWRSQSAISSVSTKPHSRRDEPAPDGSTDWPVAGTRGRQRTSLSPTPGVWAGRLVGSAGGGVYRLAPTPWVALAVMTPVPGIARIGDADTTRRIPTGLSGRRTWASLWLESNSLLEGPFASGIEEVAAFMCTYAQRWGGHAVAKRECRRMAAEDDRVDRSRQKR